MSPAPRHYRTRSWFRKFADAFAGILLAVRGERSYWVHLPAAAAAVAVAAALSVLATPLSMAEWGVLILAIAGVLTAETLNTALEYLAQAVTEDEDARVAAALDIGSGAVLLASIFAVAVALALFGPRLWELAVVWSR